MRRFEIFEHTADKGIRAWGEYRSEVFETAAYAMFSMMADLALYRATGEYTVEVDASDPEGLMVEWLSELLFLFETEHRLFVDFQVLEVGEIHLKAKAFGCPLIGVRWTGAEVKAATYHGLSVRPDGDGWLAEVIVDV